MAKSHKKERSELSRAFLPRLPFLERQAPGPLTAWSKRSITERIGLVATIIVSAIFFVAGAIHIVQEPTNPAVYILMIIFATPAMVLYFWDAYRLKKESTRTVRTLVLTGAILWSVLALNITLGIVPQLSGWVASVIWGAVILAFWTVSFVLFNYVFEGALWKKCKGLATFKVG